MPENVVNQRVRAAWRARACAAAMACGAQVFCFGAGIAMPFGLNAVWLCALPGAALCTLAAARSRSLLLAMRQGHGMAAWRALLLAAVMLLSCLFLLASMIALCGQTLLTQARALHSALLTLAFAVFAALPGTQGVSRLCYALRFLVPAAAAVCCAALVPRGAASGLFPLLGQGAPSLALGAAVTAGAAVPALMLLLPDESDRAAAVRAAPLPGAGFFALRVGVGALLGALALLLPALLGGYVELRSRGVWGDRLHIAAAGGSGLWQTLLLLAQLTAMALGATALLCAAEDALLLALPRLARRRAGLLGCAALLAVLLYLLVTLGPDAALYGAPLLAPASLMLLLPVRRSRKGKEGKDGKDLRAGKGDDAV